eukprot:CAMPEP_0201476952 /NCGR_PEP_ID=MMETSP0151_2-20130828/2082_1 /ASSEMBLY_ACC=CAM_ASM_000257 /TAXON_ID=200890 /ORGANISM="Paramoeba atlantica, Strain 621/1 / CCAP 1560/9" /LENGTH=501 /DNA_ID=CAMNT_0047857517 /DNA_START=31 /DNA_END=1533 /DNA_ORIENTATION=-
MGDEAWKELFASVRDESSSPASISDILKRVQIGEFLKSDEIDTLVDALSIRLTHSRHFQMNVLFCEWLYGLYGKKVHFSQLFVLKFLPALLWSFFTFDNVTAYEVCLLAIYNCEVATKDCIESEVATGIGESVYMVGENRKLLEMGKPGAKTTRKGESGDQVMSTPLIKSSRALNYVTSMNGTNTGVVLETVLRKYNTHIGSMSSYSKCLMSDIWKILVSCGYPFQISEQQITDDHDPSHLPLDPPGSILEEMRSLVVLPDQKEPKGKDHHHHHKHHKKGKHHHKEEEKHEGEGEGEGEKKKGKQKNEKKHHHKRKEKEPEEMKGEEEKELPDKKHQQKEEKEKEKETQKEEEEEEDKELEKVLEEFRDGPASLPSDDSLSEDGDSNDPLKNAREFRSGGKEGKLLHLTKSNQFCSSQNLTHTKKSDSLQKCQNLLLEIPVNIIQIPIPVLSEVLQSLKYCLYDSDLLTRQKAKKALEAIHQRASVELLPEILLLTIPLLN